MNRITPACLLWISIVLASCAQCFAADPRAPESTNWPMWRGPHNDGLSPSPALPLHWTSTDNITWKTPIPGKGHSSPIVWNDRIYVTTCLESEQKRMLICLARSDGDVLWQ